MKQGQKFFLSSAEIKFRQEILQFGKGKSTWEKERQSILKKLNRLKHSEKKCLRRLQYFRDFHKNQMQPAWMVLNYLPVLPPGLRPITSIRGELVVSDINTLYRKLLTRNKRINVATRFGIFDTALSGSWASWCYNLRQLQEAIDMLLKTGSIEAGKTTKSLLESLKGKKGRFRQHLLGKRVDYSGRSVIVVGPNLKIHECGIPKQMAIELFQPFIIQKLRNKGIVFTTTAAKAIIAEQNPIIWDILKEIMKNHPVLLNRAPTLHRLGIQAFLPKLVEGKAILLHPLVCPAFNADFDGDQMAVHIPLSPTARAEALTLLWSRNHLLAPSSGQPLLLPTQDMVLGCYYLTVPTPKLDKKLLLVNADSIDNSSELISVASCITASEGITTYKKQNKKKRPFLKNYQKKFLQSNIFYTLMNSLLEKNYYKTILTKTSISPKLHLMPTEINSKSHKIKNFGTISISNKICDQPEQLDQSDKPDRQTVINFPENSSQLGKSETYMPSFNKEEQSDTETRFFTELDKKFSILSNISELPINGTFNIFQNIKSYTKTKSSLQIENELTSFSNLKKKVLFFSNFDNVRQAYERGEIKIHTAIWVRWSGVTQNFSNSQNAKLKECPLEQRISIVGQKEMLFNDRYSLNSVTKKPQSEIFYYLRTTPGRILFHNFIFNSFINL
jgi:DNA-directed RNA polymerase beta' subunit